MAELSVERALVSSVMQLAQSWVLLWRNGFPLGWGGRASCHISLAADPLAIGVAEQLHSRTTGAKAVTTIWSTSAASICAPNFWAPGPWSLPGTTRRLPGWARLRLSGRVRVLIIDPDEARAALVAEGLADVKPLDVHRVGAFEEIEAQLPSLAPDVIVIACESPDRDTLESLRESNAGNPRPVVMFVDRSSPGLAEAAVEAGVAAYVVDGLSAGRVRSVLEVAMSRFGLMQKLRDDLKKAQSDLASRKDVERAKGLLMSERGLSEDQAYRLLRKLAMDSGRPIGAVAKDLLTFAGVLRGDDK